MIGNATTPRAATVPPLHTGTYEVAVLVLDVSHAITLSSDVP